MLPTNEDNITTKAESYDGNEKHKTDRQAQKDGNAVQITLKAGDDEDAAKYLRKSYLEFFADITQDFQYPFFQVRVTLIGLKRQPFVLHFTPEYFDGRDHGIGCH